MPIYQITEHIVYQLRAADADAALDRIREAPPWTREQWIVAVHERAAEEVDE